MEYYYEIESDYDFIKKALTYLFRSTVCVFLHVCMFAGTIVVALKGVKTLMQCPKQPKIPVYLFVFGAVGIVKMFQNLYDQWRMRRSKEKYDDSVLDSDYEEGGGSGNDASAFGLTFIDTALSLFLLVWFAFGNYWVLPIYKPNFVQPSEFNSNDWCSKEAYMTALIQIAVFYAILFGLLLVVLLIFIYSRLCRVRSIEEAEKNDNEGDA